MTRDPAVDGFKHWGTCDECGFQGLLIFRTREEEDYTDEEALGYIMDSSCPACGVDESVLVVVDEYREMVLMSRRSEET